MQARMRTLISAIIAALLVFPGSALSADKGLTVRGVRYFSYPTFTRIVLEIESPAAYVLTRIEGGKLMFTAYDGQLTVKAGPPAINDGVVKDVVQKQEGDRSVLYINLDRAAGDVKDFVLRNPDRIVLDISRGPASAPPPAQAPSRATIVVLDPGHGGGDTGIVTPQGQEKSLTLDLALSLKRLLQRDPRLKVILTREKDQALALDERAAISNSSGGDVFLSLHFAPGSEARVYIAEPDMEPARLPTAVGRSDFLGFETVSEQQAMLWGGQQAGHVKESGGLGKQILQQMKGAESADPVQAPLAVLKPVDAAAVLIEVGVDQDRKKAAEGIAKGIEQYVGENR